MKGELHMKADCSPQSLDDFSAFDPSENAVVVLGFPKDSFQQPFILFSDQSKNS